MTPIRKPFATFITPCVQNMVYHLWKVLAAQIASSAREGSKARSRSRGKSSGRYEEVRELTELDFEWGVCLVNLGLHILSIRSTSSPSERETARDRFNDKRGPSQIFMANRAETLATLAFETPMKRQSISLAAPSSWLLNCTNRADAWAIPITTQHELTFERTCHQGSALSDKVTIIEASPCTNKARVLGMIAANCIQEAQPLLHFAETQCCHHWRTKD